MHKIFNVLVALLIALALTSATAAQAQAPTPTPFPQAHCGGSGSFRWPVKTGADASRFNVNTTPSVTSIAVLRKLPPPTETQLDSTWATNHRINPAEFQTWQITAELVTLDLNSHDSDLDVRLQDASGHPLTTEVPWPGCVSPLSLWATDIATTRNYLDALYPTTVSQPVQTVNQMVTVTGLGFFDHSEIPGGKYYHVELHPVISVVFNPPPQS